MSDMALTLPGPFFVITDAGIEQLEAADMVDKTETDSHRIAILEAELHQTRADLMALLTPNLPKRSRLLVLAMYQRVQWLLGKDQS